MPSLIRIVTDFDKLESLIWVAAYNRTVKKLVIFCLRMNMRRPNTETIWTPDFLVYAKIRQITRPGIAFRQKLICVWTYEKGPRIIRLNPK